MKKYIICFDSFHLENGIQEGFAEIEAKNKKEAINILMNKKMLIKIKKVDIKRS